MKITFDNTILNFNAYIDVSIRKYENLFNWNVRSAVEVTIGERVLTRIAPGDLEDFVDGKLNL